MSKNGLIGGYPVIGIRPVIDGRRGALKVRESLERKKVAMLQHLLISNCRNLVNGYQLQVLS